MKIIINNIIPFKGYKAMNLFGIIFARKKLSAIDINHEQIHTAQMRDLLYIGFYLWYFIEWLIRLILCLNNHKAYKNICFEKEAYNFQSDMNYSHKYFSFLKYIR